MAIVIDARKISCDPWCLPTDLKCGGDYPDEDLTAVIAAAQSMLDERTGFRFKTCNWRLRPYDHDCSEIIAPVVPVLYTIKLSTPDRSPIQSITEIVSYDRSATLTTLDDDSYRLYGNELVFNDGTQVYMSQNPTDALGAAYTWAVTLKAGVPVPQDGLYACADLARFILSDRSPISLADCKKLDNVRSMVRDGLAFEYDLKMFGIKSVDWFLSSHPKPKGFEGFANPFAITHTY